MPIWKTNGVIVTWDTRRRSVHALRVVRGKKWYKGNVQKENKRGLSVSVSSVLLAAQAVIHQKGFFLMASFWARGVAVLVRVLVA